MIDINYTLYIPGFMNESSVTVLLDLDTAFQLILHQKFKIKNSKTHIVVFKVIYKLLQKKHLKIKS